MIVVQFINYRKGQIYNQTLKLILEHRKNILTNKMKTNYLN